MHDIAFIRANPAAFDAALARRGLEPQADRIVALDAKKREAAEQKSKREEAARESHSFFAGEPPQLSEEL